MRGKCLEKGWGARILSFKESYKKDYENIKTDEAFKNRLSEEMKVAAPEKHKKVRIVFYTAAAAVIVFALGFRFLIFTPNNGEAEIIQQVDTVTTVSTASGLFAQEKWYAGAETDAEIWDKFKELIGGGNVTSLYRGGSEQLGEADILSGAEAEELSRKLASAVPCGEKELSGEISFCMVVFGDGKIVKFRISDSGEVQLNDTELVCRFE